MKSNLYQHAALLFRLGQLQHLALPASANTAPDVCLLLSPAYTQMLPDVSFF